MRRRERGYGIHGHMKLLGCRTSSKMCSLASRFHHMVVELNIDLHRDLWTELISIDFVIFFAAINCLLCSHLGRVNTWYDSVAEHPCCCHLLVNALAHIGLVSLADLPPVFLAFLLRMSTYLYCLMVLSAYDMYWNNFNRRAEMWGACDHLCVLGKCKHSSW